MALRATIAKRGLFETEPKFLRGVSGERDWVNVDAAELSRARGLDMQWLADIVQYQTPLTLRTCRPDIINLRPGMHVSNDSSSDFPVANFPEVSSNAALEHQDMAAIDKALRAAIALLRPADTVFHLSAGMDSSLLVLLACEIHGADNIRAITFRARGASSDIEASIVEDFCKQRGIDLIVLDLSRVDIWSVAPPMIAALGMPAGHPSTLLRFIMDKHIANTGATTVVSGRGADEVFAGYRWHLPDFKKAQHQDRIRATAPAMVKALFPKWAGESDAAYAKFFSGNDSLDRRLCYDIATLGADWKFIETQIGDALGLETVAPFADANIAQIAFHLPETLKISGMSQKVGLRQYYAALYPAVFLEQPKRGLSFDIGTYLQDFTLEEILYHIGADWIESLGPHINSAVLSDMVKTTLTGESNFGWQIWNVYLASLLSNSYPLTSK